MTSIWFAVIFGIVLGGNILGCGGSKSSESGGAIAAKSASEIHGEWRLKEVSIEGEADKVAITGAQAIRFRGNDTYFMEYEGFSLTAFGQNEYVSCMGYSSGRFKVDDGSLILSDRVFAMTDGTCGALLNGYVLSAESSSGRVFIEGSMLLMKQDFSYTDENGTSKVGTMVHRYEKRDDEQWSGEGFDPAYAGKWQQSKMIAEKKCGLAEDGAYDITFKGSLLIDLEVGQFEQVLSGYEDPFFSPACSAAVNGTVNAKRLHLETVQTSSSADCAKDSGDTTGVTTMIERDIVAPSGVYVSLTYTNIATANCEGGVEGVGVIRVFEAQ